MPDSNQTHHFFRTLFGEKPDHTHILVWTLQKKESFWATTTEEAESHVERNVNSRDVYFGVGLSPKSYGNKERCKASEIAGIVGLWADIDIADPHHKKQNLPPDVKSAMDLIQTMGIEPTIVIHSGHGLQAHWVFREPWMFESDEERKEASTLIQRWNGTFKLRAAEFGWDVDSTHDLSRVFRVPGTVNRKGDPVPVTMVSCDPLIRFNPSDFEPFLFGDIQAPKKKNELSEAEPGLLNLYQDASPPFDKFELLQSVEPKVMLTWNRKRKDFQDHSASSYDISLATFAAMYGWSDQEIVNLIIASRRKHGDDLKLRQDYYQRTLARARQDVKKSQAEEALEEIAAAEEQSVPDEERKATIREAISQIFGLNIHRIIKEIGSPPNYLVETDRGEIKVGEVKNLIGQKQLRDCMADAGKMMPKFKPGKWEQIAQMLLDLCEERSIGDEATDKGLAKTWIQHYLEDHNPSDDHTVAAIMKAPFCKNGYTYIFGEHFRKWLTIEFQEKVSSRVMGSMFRSYGCDPEQLAVTINGENTTRNVWRLPKK